MSFVEAIDMEQPMAMDEAAVEEAVMSGFRVNTNALAVGALLVLLGSALFGGALMVAISRWVKALETPPQETARQKFRQLQSVYAAGSKAWRDGLAVVDAPTENV